MASDYDKAVALRSYIARKFTSEQIQTIADQAFAAMQDGRTQTNVVVDGVVFAWHINCEPATLLQACESVLVDLGVTSATLQTIFPRFNQQFIQP